MASLGDRPAAKITTREIEAMLAEVAATGVSPRSVNLHRALVSAIFNYGRKDSTFALPANPAAAADGAATAARGARLLHPGGNRGALARAFEGGLHRDASRPAISDEEHEARRTEDLQDAELVRVAAYTGLRARRAARLCAGRTSTSPRTP